MPRQKARDRVAEVAAEEWETRVALAACYRLVAEYRRDDLIWSALLRWLDGKDPSYRD